MIPTIGIMVGFYIVARILDLLDREGPNKASKGVRAVAFVVMIVNVLGILVLFNASLESSSALGQ